MYLLIIILFSLSDKVKTDQQAKFLETKCGSESFSVNVDCHYFIYPDDIQVLSKANYSEIPENSIFFIETSCNGGLSYRQACSVESAALAHPQRLIVVLFAGPVDISCLKISPLYELLQFSNIRFFRIHIKKFIKGTPIEKLLNNGNFFQSHYPVHHTSDILRYTTLNRFGGIYLDLDVIVAKPFDQLPTPKNWVGKQSHQRLSTALLALQNSGIGLEISDEVLRRLKYDFSPYSLEYSNNEVLVQALLRKCGTDDINKISYSKCKGFAVYDSQLFYPIPLIHTKMYFKKLHGRISTVPYAFHLWNYVSQRLTIYNDTLYSKLINTFCPKISKLMY